MKVAPAAERRQGGAALGLSTLSCAPPGPDGGSHEGVPLGRGRSAEPADKGQPEETPSAPRHQPQGTSTCGG